MFENYETIEALEKADILITYTCDVTPSLKATEALRDFVTALNAVHSNTVLDTIRREEAGEAFVRLAQRFTRVTEAEADTWFDRWRDF